MLLPVGWVVIPAVEVVCLGKASPVVSRALVLQLAVAVVQAP